MDTLHFYFWMDSDLECQPKAIYYPEANLALPLVALNISACKPFRFHPGFLFLFAWSWRLKRFCLRVQFAVLLLRLPEENINRRVHSVQCIQFLSLLQPWRFQLTTWKMVFSSMYRGPQGGCVSRCTMPWMRLHTESSVDNLCQLRLKHFLFFFFLQKTEI